MEKQTLTRKIGKKKITPSFNLDPINDMRDMTNTLPTVLDVAEIDYKEFK